MMTTTMTSMSAWISWRSHRTAQPRWGQIGEPVDLASVKLLAIPCHCLLSLKKSRHLKVLEKICERLRFASFRRCIWQYMMYMPRIQKYHPASTNMPLHAVSIFRDHLGPSNHLTKRTEQNHHPQVMARNTSFKSVITRNVLYIHISIYINIYIYKSYIPIKMEWYIPI